MLAAAPPGRTHLRPLPMSRLGVRHTKVHRHLHAGLPLQLHQAPAARRWQKQRPQGALLPINVTAPGAEAFPGIPPAAYKEDTRVYVQIV